MTVSLSHYLILALLLFGIGLYGVLTRRNAICVLIGLELMFNAVNINLAAFSRTSVFSAGSQAAGQIFAIFVMAVAAAEAAVGLALVICLYRNYGSIQVDEADNLKG